MKVVFLSIAEKELGEAIVFYEKQLEGLGNRFCDEIQQAVDLMVKYPEGFKKVGPRTHKCILRFFPYAILYVYEEGEIVVSAIAHQHRHPISYLNRIR